MAKKQVEKEAKTDVKDMGRLIAIFSYITPIGWLLALILNLNNKTSLGSFHVRQTLLLWVAWMVLSWIPVIGWIIVVVLLVFLIMGLVYAINGKQKGVPIIGPLAQEWFKGL